MTADQIEAAARELCRIRGLDPDTAEKVGEIHGVPVLQPLLFAAREDVERFAQIGTAIAHALTPVPQKPKRAKKK